MTHINCDDPNPLFFNPKFGIDLQGKAPKGIPLPTYGNYGGPNISGPLPPVDALDTLFRSHDEAILKAIISDSVLTPDELVQPHAILINDIHHLLESDPVDDAGNPVYDAGATLYGGFTIFALTGQLAQFGLSGALDEALKALTKQDEPDDPPPYTRSAALNDAQGYMESGLAQLLPEEAGEARSLHGMLSIFEDQFADVLIA